MNVEPVEFVVNCFERNIVQVTRPGALEAAVAQHRYPFALRTLLVNNVADRPLAARLAQAAVDRGEIDRFAFVEDHLDRALRVTGLRRSDFGRYLHWSDCCLVALTLDGPELLCYVDVDLALRGDGSWISASLAAFKTDSRLCVANPNWRMADGTTSVAEESDESAAGIFIGYGFTDQIFLCRRSDFCRPLLNRWLPLVLSSPASARYFGWQAPRHNTLFFEQIVDAFMRRKRMMRLTLTGWEFEPIPLSSYPARGLVERAAGRFNGVVLRITRWGRRRFGWPDPRLRVSGLLDPAFAVSDAQRT